jgi:SAM-dependent methyltransferase
MHPNRGRPTFGEGQPAKPPKRSFVAAYAWSASSQAHRSRVARQRFTGTDTVTIVEHTFESWPLEPEAFDLVAVAQAFHWLSPATRFPKAAAALRPGGALGCSATAR